MAEPKSSAPLFAALGDETRLRLVSRLCDVGPMSITRLTAGSKVTRQAITKHLRVIEGAARGCRVETLLDAVFARAITTRKSVARLAIRRFSGLRAAHRDFGVRSPRAATR